MTIEELIEKLKATYDLGQEEGHIRADALLLEFIDDPRVTAAHGDVAVWFA